MDNDKELNYILESFFRDIKNTPGCNNISATCERCALVVNGGLHPKTTFLSHLMSEGHNDLIAEYEKVKPLSILKKDHVYYIKDGPIIQLFMSLIKNGYKQNTVLSNVQLISILNKEFNIDVMNTHELELEIYINVTKKYLKDWPEWEEFENIVNSLKTDDSNDKLTAFMQNKYKKLKEYLANMLGIAKFLASDVVSKISAKTDMVSSKKEENQFVMQIHANRSQLNNLIRRRPVGNNIFNIPANIGLCESSDLTIDSILNSSHVSFDVSIKISEKETNALVIRYENKHILKHNLVNRKLKKSPTNTKLSPYWHIKPKYLSKQSKNVDCEMILDSFNEYVKRSETTEGKEILSSIGTIIKKILPTMPQTLLTNTLYTRFLSQYPFVRYLYDDSNDQSNDEYDIQLEETITPVCVMNVNYLSYGSVYLKLNCVECRVTFRGMNVASEMIEHYRNYHSAEQCWQCTKCKVEINAELLMINNWKHSCQSEGLIVNRKN